VLIVTNNNKVYEKYNKKRDVLFLEDATYLQVLEKVRNLVHEGAKLLTHPMAGSLKPNQTPYRSVMLNDYIAASFSSEKPSLDMQSLQLIENSIEVTKKFISYKTVPNWPLKIKEDFKTVDLSLIDSAINRSGGVSLETGIGKNQN